MDLVSSLYDNLPSLQMLAHKEKNFSKRSVIQSGEIIQRDARNRHTQTKQTMVDLGGIWHGRFDGGFHK